MSCDKPHNRKDEKGVGSHTTYKQAAMSIALNLREFCDEDYAYPDMVMMAASRARSEIDHLRMIQATDAMVIGAFRYTLGRMTYAVEEFVSWLIPRWWHISLAVRDLIQRELEGEFKRDDQSRQQGQELKGHPDWYSKPHPLGHDCDRESWQLVRDLWREETK